MVLSRDHDTRLCIEACWGQMGLKLSVILTDMGLYLQTRVLLLTSLGSQETQQDCTLQDLTHTWAQ